MAILGEDAFHANIISDDDVIVHDIFERVNLSERIILRNKYPVQELLAQMFNCDIEVLPIFQSEQSGVIVRWVQLISNKKILCYANSVIPFSPAQIGDTAIDDTSTPINPRGFITGIREQNMGIGQLLDSLELKIQRSLKSIYVNEHFIARIYEITSATEGIELNLTINETFPRSIFNK